MGAKIILIVFLFLPLAGCAPKQGEFDPERAAGREYQEAQEACNREGIEYRECMKSKGWRE